MQCKNSLNKRIMKIKCNILIICTATLRENFSIYNQQILFLLRSALKCHSNHVDILIIADWAQKKLRQSFHENSPCRFFRKFSKCSHALKN